VAAIHTVIDEILQENEQVLKQVDVTAIDKLIEQLRQAPRVFVSGKGRSGFVARSFAMRLMHLGLTAYVVDETTTPAIQQHDLLITYSGSGTTLETCLGAEKAKETGATVVAITTEPESRLARAASLVIVLSAPHKNTSLSAHASVQYAGSLFEQSSLLFCDSVVLQAMRTWNASKADLATRHTNIE
jgi:6-phospho-3-hexuloisomerase